MAWFAPTLLAIEAGFALYTSWLSLSRPAAFAGMLGLELPGDSGVNEIRSQYGGFFLAMALVQGAALAGTLPLSTGLVVGAMTFGGLAFGRIWSCLQHHGTSRYTPTIRALVLLDPLGFLLSAAALWSIS
jgi:hypothetical protein